MKQEYGPHVRVRLDDHKVALVEIDAPPHNFINMPMIRGLVEALEELDGENGCVAVVLASAGKSFCAGADLEDATGIGAQGPVAAQELYDNAVALFSTAKPIIAAVQGAAIGAGLGLALVADFRIASPEARFSANFVKLGYHPGFGITKTLPRAIGEQRAELMCLTGRRIKGEEALAWGLVEQLVPADQLRAAAIALAREIAENAPLAVAATRKTFRGALAESVRKQTSLELVLQTMLRATEDHQEGVRSVAERRPGKFAGR
ncbi:MAG: enoyl-CoA hydratase/isomerase family protein [Hyphomonadaceae bacterium]|nr:enoyl-CoA hydratase/isomerase family protein [Hyphomonadaceae bacterium]